MIELTNVFNEQFLSDLKEVLDEVCVDDQSITRIELVKKLGFTLLGSKEEKRQFHLMEQIITAALVSGALPGYELKTGIKGGISKIAENLSDEQRSSRAKKVPADFVEKLKTVLESKCDMQGTPVPRQELASSLGADLPLTKTMDLMSAAIYQKLIPGFIMKRGAEGGIKRDVGKP